MKIVLCYVRHTKAPEPEEEEAEDRNVGPRSEYYLAGLLVDRQFYGDPVLARGQLPAQGARRLLDLLCLWAPGVMPALQQDPCRVGHLMVQHWMELDGEDPIRYLEVEEDVDQADLVESWMPLETETEIDLPE